MKQSKGKLFSIIVMSSFYHVSNNAHGRCACLDVAAISVCRRSVC